MGLDWFNGLHLLIKCCACAKVLDSRCYKYNVYDK